MWPGSGTELMVKLVKVNTPAKVREKSIDEAPKCAP